jgi:hypothetical protein
MLEIHTDEVATPLLNNSPPGFNVKFGDSEELLLPGDTEAG